MVDGHYPYIIRHISFFYYLKQNKKNKKLIKKKNHTDGGKNHI
jgi:hypothetical protein